MTKKTSDPSPQQTSPKISPLQPDPDAFSWLSTAQKQHRAWRRVLAGLISSPASTFYTHPGYVPISITPYTLINKINNMAPLPPDLMATQLSTIDLLAAMFPSPGELDLDASTKECIDKVREWCECEDPTAAASPPAIPSSILLAVNAPLSNANGKTIQVNVSIPLHSQDSRAADEAPAIIYSLRQPDWMSKAEVAKLASGMPAGDVFAALEFIQEEATAFLGGLNATSACGQPSIPAQSIKEPLVRVWFYFPSLSTRAKRADMVNYAPDYGLTGFVLAGKPGVLCLEGASKDIDSYMSFIKTHSWGDIPAHQKKVSERFRETVGVERVFAGMEEITDSLGERAGQRANRGDMQALEAWLGRRGLGEAFEKVIF